MLVLTAGTSDIPVAEEAVVTIRALGHKVTGIYDVGAAGLHRLASVEETMRIADVIIVCAGMDGVLATLVAGLVGGPVVAVPTSIGYGAGAGGIAPLLTMLNACAPGVAVVNIDNGFGAAVLAVQIVRRRASLRNASSTEFTIDVTAQQELSCPRNHHPASHLPRPGHLADGVVGPERSGGAIGGVE